MEQPPKSLMDSSAQDVHGRLDEFILRCHTAEQMVSGYPANLMFNSEQLTRANNTHLNNAGDPFQGTPYPLSTHDFEREVIEMCAELVGAKSGDAWGFVTTGSTAANLKALHMARSLYPTGVLVCSQDTHCSVLSIAELLRIDVLRVASTENGSIDPEDFRNKVQAVNRPIIAFANIGTTMKGAIDDVSSLREILATLKLEHYLHADAALSGMILPFVDDPPVWDFRAMVDSIAISGHKMLGVKSPCGVFLSTKTAREREHSLRAEYIGSDFPDISCSRSGHAPLHMWYAMKSLGYMGLKTMVTSCLQTAHYAVDRLNAVGVPAWRNPNSITVVMPRPSDTVVHKYAMATEGQLGHIITMPNVGRDRVDAIVRDLTSCM